MLKLLKKKKCLCVNIFTGAFRKFWVRMANSAGPEGNTLNSKLELNFQAEN